MNIFLHFSVMAVAQSQKQESIFFGGDLNEWQNDCCHSSASLTCYLSEWAILKDKCKNQSFKSQDGNLLSWDRFLEELARWFDVRMGIQGPGMDESKFQTIGLAGGEDASLGYGPSAVLRISRSLAD